MTEMSQKGLSFLSRLRTRREATPSSENAESLGSLRISSTVNLLFSFIGLFCSFLCSAM